LSIKEFLEDDNRQNGFSQWQNIMNYVDSIKRTAKTLGNNEKVEQLLDNISFDLEMIVMTGFDGSNQFTEIRFNRACKNIKEVTDLIELRRN
jgi:glycogen debranching enzyme